MKAFLDTSVLFATFYGDHEHHEPRVVRPSGKEKRGGGALGSSKGANRSSRVETVMCTLKRCFSAKEDESVMGLRLLWRLLVSPCRSLGSLPKS
jgi:hypothetical protein